MRPPTLALVCVLVMSASARGDEPAEHAYELGVRLRGAFLPSSLLGAVAQTSSSLQTIDGGIEFVVRKQHYDVVTSVDLLFLDLADANFLQNGRDPTQDVHYVAFGNFGQLDFLSTDVSIVGHTALTKWLEFRYGAGVGLGLVLGDVHVITNGRQCTAQNFQDPSQCYPHSADGSVNIPLNQPNAAQQLAATEKPGAADLADDPHWHVTNDKPPVMVVLNVQLGLRFYVQKHLSFDVDAGFRDVLFVGGSMHVSF